MDPRECSGSHRLREVEQAETRLEVPVAEALVGEVGATETPFAVATAARGVRYHYAVTTKAADRSSNRKSCRSKAPLRKAERLPESTMTPPGADSPPGYAGRAR